MNAQAANPTPQRVQIAGQDATNDLVVSVGKSVVIDCADRVERITIGLGEIAEATAVSPTEILVNGKTPGETSLIVWEAGGGRQFFNLSVRASRAVVNDRLEGLRRQLRTELPDQKITVTAEGDQVFLRGKVKDLASSDRAVQIGSSVGKVVNLLYVAVPAAEPQILLKTKFASVDRTTERQLGINFFSLGAGNTIGTVTTGQFGAPSISSPTGNNPTATLSDLLNIFVFRSDLDLGATIKALEQNGMLEVLAEPNLLTENKKQASFLAGGEYPIPVVQGAGVGGVGAVTIQYKQYGVFLTFIPSITPRNTIHLQIIASVSSLDYANGVTISGFTVPGISARSVKTEVELAQGQSFAIGGLLDNRETETLMKIPFIGDVPVLGKLFQSMQRSRSNAELMVLVTPELASPLPAGQPTPQPNYSQEFMPPNSNIPMSNPTLPVTAAAVPASIPIEQLLDSLKPETPLNSDMGPGGGGGYGASGGGTQMTQPMTH
ncbi:MAG TPA: pilus assembly protein N-terminal domain-containing protein [Acidobacteriaceae bacterium]